MGRARKSKPRKTESPKIESPDDTSQWFWFCHFCEDGPQSTRINLACVTCGHWRCDHCTVKPASKESISSLISATQFLRPEDEAEVRKEGKRDTKTLLKRAEEEGKEPVGFDNEDITHLLDPFTYFQKLDDLELRVAMQLGLFPDCQKVPSAESFEKLWEHDMRFCQDAFGKFFKALGILCHEGFCQGNFSVLVQDPERVNVAFASLVQKSYLDRFQETLNIIEGDWDSLVDTHDDWDALITAMEALQLITRCPTLFAELNGTDDKEAFKRSLIRNLSILYVFLAYGILSYTGSHVCRFDMNVFGLEETLFHITDNFALQQQKLACLDEYIGGPAWIFGKPRVLQHSECVISIRPDIFADLWGPLHVICAQGEPGSCSGYRCERDFISFVDHKQSTVLRKPSEALCHWISISSKTETLSILKSRSVQTFTDLLIGMRNDNPPTTSSDDKTYEAAFSENKTCARNLKEIQMRRASEFHFPGTCNPYYEVEGAETSMSAGYYVTGSFTTKWKRKPGITYKSMLLEYCNRPSTKFLPDSILRLRVGLEISACTNNAQRITLWEALRLSRCQIVNMLGPSKLPTQIQCKHAVGDRTCLLSCWNIRSALPLSISTQMISSLDLWSAQPAALPHEDELRNALITALMDIATTGVDAHGTLQAWWPFTNDPHTLGISSGSCRWIPMVKDTRDVATFAVMSDRCLEFPTQGGKSHRPVGFQCPARTSSSAKHLYPDRTLLHTTLQLHTPPTNLPQLSTSKSHPSVGVVGETMHFSKFSKTPLADIGDVLIIDNNPPALAHLEISSWKALFNTYKRHKNSTKFCTEVISDEITSGKTISVFIS